MGCCSAHKGKGASTAVGGDEPFLLIDSSANKLKAGEKIAAKIRMPHPFHERPLCFLQNNALFGSSHEIYKQLIGNSKFV